MDDLYKKTAKQEWSIEDLILATIDHEQRREEVKSWFGQPIWKAIFKMLTRENVIRYESEKKEFISWLISNIATCNDCYALYYRLLGEIRNTNSSSCLTQLRGDEYLPEDEEISLIFPKPLLIDHIKRNMPAYFPLKAMEVKNRFLLYNLPTLDHDFSFNIHRTSFYYHSKTKAKTKFNTSSSQRLSDLGGETLNGFLHTSGFNSRFSDLVILTFNKSVLVDDGLRFFRPKWTDKILVRGLDTGKYDKLEEYLDSKGLEIGIAPSENFKIKALDKIEFF